MNQAAAAPTVRLEDYFEAEVECAEDAAKHEWVDGVVYVASVELATYADASVVCSPVETITVHGAKIDIDKVYG